MQRHLLVLQLDLAHPHFCKKVFRRSQSLFRLSSVSQRGERSNVPSMLISFHPSFRYSGMFKSENVALEFSARTAAIRWQCKMIADVVGNCLFDTIVLCHVFSRMLRKLCHNSIRCTNLTSRSARSTRNIFCSKGRLSTY